MAKLWVIAKREYLERVRTRWFYIATFFGPLLFGGLMIERNKAVGGENPIEQMLDVLDGGDSLILFPEGTRGSGDAVAPFRAGLHYIAEARPVVELIPVHLENLNRILPKGEFAPVPMLSRVTFGSVLARIPGEDRASFLDRARKAVIELGEE